MFIKSVLIYWQEVRCNEIWFVRVALNCWSLYVQILLLAIILCCLDPFGTLKLYTMASIWHTSTCMHVPNDCTMFPYTQFSSTYGQFSPSVVGPRGPTDPTVPSLISSDSDLARTWASQQDQAQWGSWSSSCLVSRPPSLVCKGAKRPGLGGLSELTTLPRTSTGG